MKTEGSRKDDNQEGTANILNLGRIFLTSRNEFILRATSVPRSSLAKYLALRARARNKCSDSLRAFIFQQKIHDL